MNRNLDKILTYAAKLVVNPDDPDLMDDPFFVQKKEIILELLNTLSMPKSEGSKILSFPSKDQLELRKFYARIAGTDKVA